MKMSGLRPRGARGACAATTKGVSPYPIISYVQIVINVAKVTFTPIIRVGEGSNPLQRKQGFSEGRLKMPKTETTVRDEVVERIQHENQCSVSVTRGQRGTYGWDIKVYDEDPAIAAGKAVAVDTLLREAYKDA